MKITKKKLLLIAVAAFLVLAALNLGASKKGGPTYTSAKVDRGEVAQTVSATGTVEAVKKVDLKFLSSGKIEVLSVKVGDAVTNGQILASLDTAKLDSQLAEAEASMAAAQANLNALLEGASAEDIRLAQTAIDNAQTARVGAQQGLEDTRSSSEKDIASAQASLESAKANLESVKGSNQNSLDNAYDTAWDTIGSSLTACDDALNANDTALENEDAQDTLGVLNTQYLYASNTSKVVAANSRDAAESYRRSVSGSASHEQIETAIPKAQKALEDARKTLSDTYNVLQATVTSAELTPAKLDALKASISTQRSAINAAILSLNGKKQAIATQKVANQTALTSAQSAVNTATSTLSSAQAGATAKINAAQNTISLREGDLKAAQDKMDQVKARPSAAKISASRAQVEQARANAELIQGQLADAVILAPCDAVVTGVTGEVGEVAATTEPVVSLMIPNGFQITSNISEVSISKVKVGNEVGLTFDALGMDQVFRGKISEIDPAQTEISGVVYYKVTTIFTADGSVVKAGMTSNLDVMTARKESVLRIPLQALKEKEGRKYVQAVEAAQVKELPVEIGLRGDTYVEVMSGLRQGQEIATFVQQ
jgi:RND family efflux transporter MFP subunit